MAIVNSRAAIEPKTGKAAIFVNETIHSLMRKLFSNGEQGFFYDPNDLSTMFQDAAGTVPVTGAGQPVGLVLDKSKGLVVGANKAILDRYIEQGVGGLDFKTVHVSGALETGFWYKVTINVSNYSGTGDVGVTGTNTAFPISSVSTGIRSRSSNGIISFIALAQTSSTVVLYTRSSNNADFTGISIQKISGNHAYQATSAYCPILRQNAVTGANYLEFDGTDDSLQTGNINFTATDKVSLFAGLRKLSDAATSVVTELSATVDGNTGAFRLTAPTSGGHAYQYISRGSTAQLAAANATNLAAPHSAVISTKSDINADISSLRINGILTGTSASDQGTGNYGNHPLYIGRRAGTNLPFNGHLYSLIGIGRLTTDAETIALEKSIAKNTGVTLSV